MLTPPSDLSEADLRAALEAGWVIQATSLTYRPVGFGSHHWEVDDASGTRWFVTVDDLRARRLRPDEPLADTYQRLRAALTAAVTLRASGLDFVVAPWPTGDAEPLLRLGECFAVAVYPYVVGESFGWGTYTAEHRRAVVALVATVHQAASAVRGTVLVDDFVIPFRDLLGGRLGGSFADHDELGPFTAAAVELLGAHQAGVRRALDRYDELVAGVRADPPAMVLTHGEPHPGNTMRRNGHWLLIDWDTALVAPPERDLWDLDEGDGSIHAAYTALTGTRLRPELIELYRLRWDLTDVAVSLARFTAPHARTADDRETWKILEETVPTLGR